MPTKHIPDSTWRKVEKEMVKAVIATQRPIKESDMLRALIEKGIEKTTDDDYTKMVREGKR